MHCFYPRTNSYKLSETYLIKQIQHHQHFKKYCKLNIFHSASAATRRAQLGSATLVVMFNGSFPVLTQDFIKED